MLPGLGLWAGLVVCVLRGFTSQLALWRLLSTVGLWRYPRIQAPVIPLDRLAWPPPDLVLVRTPRYAQRNNGPRPTTAQATPSPAPRRPALTHASLPTAPSMTMAGVNGPRACPYGVPTHR